jgi:hypothetical protein
MTGMSWALSVIGVWMIISPSTVGRHPEPGVVLSGVIPGALAFVLGIVSTVMVYRGNRIL